MELKERIERVLAEILADKYDCKVVLRFEKEGAKHGNKKNNN